VGYSANETISCRIEGGNRMDVRIRKVGLIVLAVAALGVASACSSDSTTDTGATSAAAGTSTVPCETPEPGDGTPIAVAEKDFTVTADPDSAKKGSTTFNVDNSGPSTHEFVVFATDLDQADLPLGDDGNVDEEGTGVTHIDEIEDIGAGCQASLTVDLDAGNYVLICNLPGHYAAGMHAAFTVK
jgi:uncharacterized cupredoxin-like copper-binding protein